jgi:hypothetical protein
MAPTITNPGETHYLVDVYCPYFGPVDSLWKLGNIKKCLDNMEQSSPLLCWTSGQAFMEVLDGTIMVTARILLQFDQASDAKIKQHIDGAVLSSEFENRGIYVRSVEYIDTCKRFDEVCALL